MPSDCTTLAKNEREELARHEATIESGYRSMFEVGAALGAILGARLYKGTHSDFDSYVSQRWDISKASAYRAINAASVVRELHGAGFSVLPANSDQAIALLKVKSGDEVAAEHRRTAWRWVVENAEAANAPITAAMVKEHVDRYNAEEAKKVSQVETLSKQLTPEGLDEKERQRAALRAREGINPANLPIKSLLPEGVPPPPVVSTAPPKSVTEVVVKRDTDEFIADAEDAAEDLKDKFGTQIDLEGGHVVEHAPPSEPEKTPAEVMGEITAENQAMGLYDPDPPIHVEQQQLIGINRGGGVWEKIPDSEPPPVMVTLIAVDSEDNAPPRFVKGAAPAEPVELASITLLNALQNLHPHTLDFSNRQFASVSIAAERLREAMVFVEQSIGTMILVEEERQQARMDKIRALAAANPIAQQVQETILGTRTPSAGKATPKSSAKPKGGAK